MLKIIVATQELKDKLLAESEYIHGLSELDTDKANTLPHLYMAPHLIEVNPDLFLVPKQDLPLLSDVLEFDSFESLPMTGENHTLYSIPGDNPPNRDVYKWIDNRYCKVVGYPNMFQYP